MSLGRVLSCVLFVFACAGCAGWQTMQPVRQSDVRPIGSLQGRGDASALATGAPVTVEGVVTLVFDSDALPGWFLQDAGDGDDATSDGIYVVSDHPPRSQVDGSPIPVRVGDHIRVRGYVSEVAPPGDRADGTLTALGADGYVVLGQAALPSPVVLTAPPDDWERYEGMRVRIDAPLTLTGQDELQRRGVLAASFGGRLFSPTEVAAPGDAAREIADDNARRRLLLDDASDAENPALPAYLAGQPVPRSGSTLTGVEGVVDLRGRDGRLHLTAPLRVQAAPRPGAPTVGGDVRLAAFNLQNLFNGDGRGGGFPTPRGARSPEELQAQLDKLVATIRGLDPDIAALMELENDGYGPRSSVAQLVDALNAGGGDWTFVDAGAGPGTNAIRVGLLYRRGKVAPVGRPATLSGGPFGERSRVPLAQAFRRDRGPAFVVVANHFKSKGCSEAEGADRDQRDGQACWNATRLDSSQRLMRWLKGDPTRSGSDLVAIVGDFNAYAQEDPIQAFLRAGWQDALSAANVADSYSFVFDGQAGRLDHALLSPALKARLAGAAKWHSNADEPDNVGYRDANSAEQRRTPWRSSDHDPLLVGLRLGTP